MEEGAGGGGDNLSNYKRNWYGTTQNVAEFYLDHKNNMTIQDKAYTLKVYSTNIS